MEINEGSWVNRVRRARETREGIEGYRGDDARCATRSGARDIEELKRQRAENADQSATASASKWPPSGRICRPGARVLPQA